MIRAERNLGRFVVRHRDHFMAETPQQFRPRVYPFFVIADLKQDSLRFRRNGNLLAGLLVGDHVFTRRRGRQDFHPRLGAFHVFRRFHPARAVALHLENVELRDHGLTRGVKPVSDHTSFFMSTEYYLSHPGNPREALSSPNWLVRSSASPEPLSEPFFRRSSILRGSLTPTDAWCWYV